MASSRLWGAAALAATALVVPASGLKADAALTNPMLGRPEAIAEGRRLYRTRCYICHLSQGGRGPNLFATKLTDEQFLETAINGRITMPAMGALLSPDDIWNVHAYVKSTDHYE